MEQSPPIGQRPRLLLQGGGPGFKLSPFEMISLFVVLLVASYGGYSVFASEDHLNKAPPPAQTFAPVVRTTLTSSVTATGTINSSQQVSLTFDVGQNSGKISQFFVGLGDQVTAGQALAKLDDTDLQQNLKSAQSALNSNQARLAAVTAPSTADITAAQQTISSAQSQVTNANNTLTTLRNGPLPADQLAAQQAVISAQGALDSANNAVTKGQTQVQTDQQAVSAAQSDLNTAQSSSSSAATTLRAASTNFDSALSACSPTPSIFPPPASISGQASTLPPLAFNLKCGMDSGGTTSHLTALQTQLTAYNSAVGTYNTAISGIQTKQNAVTSAQTTLKNDQNQISTLESSVDNAKASLATAQQKKQDTLAPPKASDVQAAQDSLTSAQKSVESAQARYDQLLHPRPETVLPLQAAVDQSSADLETAKKNLAAATITAPFDGQISQLNGDVGTGVTSSTVVFILLNANTLRIDANVDQAYISQLKPNQIGNVTFDALPGRTYQATVTAVGLTPTVQQGVVSYIVTLGIDTTRIPQGTPVPTPGMTASVSVVTSRTPNALSVPTRAVRRIGRNETVTVKTPTGTEQRTVTTGATNGTLLQITGGLTDSDEVQVGAPAAASTGTQRPAGGFGGPGGARPGGG